MPRLESITVSHSILSLTCDRNKAVLKATFSAISSELRLLSSQAALSADWLRLGAPVHMHKGSVPLTRLPRLIVCGHAHGAMGSFLQHVPCSQHFQPFPPIFMAIFLPAGRWFCPIYITLSIKSV